MDTCDEQMRLALQFTNVSWAFMTVPTCAVNGILAGKSRIGRERGRCVCDCVPRTVLMDRDEETTKEGAVRETKSVRAPRLKVYLVWFESSLRAR